MIKFSLRVHDRGDDVKKYDFPLKSKNIEKIKIEAENIITDNDFEYCKWKIYIVKYNDNESKDILKVWEEGEQNCEIIWDEISTYVYVFRLNK